jgi:hypothetical protein
MNGSEPLLIAIIALSGVLISAIIGGVIAFATSRKSLYVNAVTVERSKWIEKLRNNLAEYPAIAHSVFYEANKATKQDGPINLSPEYFVALKQLQTMKSLLKLQLNPRGRIDQNIILLVDRIYELARTLTRGPELEGAEILLVLHSQFLLKEEWEKVKSEARSTWFRANEQSEEAARDYEDFVAKAGAIPNFNLTGGSSS